MEKNAILACWIVNQAGMRGGRPLKVSDLIRPEKRKDDVSPEDARKMIEDMAWQHKQKFWTKIGDKYIKKEDE